MQGLQSEIILAFEFAFTKSIITEYRASHDLTLSVLLSVYSSDTSCTTLSWIAWLGCSLYIGAVMGQILRNIYGRVVVWTQRNPNKHLQCGLFGRQLECRVYFRTLICVCSAFFANLHNSQIEMHKSKEKAIGITSAKQCSIHKSEELSYRRTERNKIPGDYQILKLLWMLSDDCTLCAKLSLRIITNQFWTIKTGNKFQIGCTLIFKNLTRCLLLDVEHRWRSDRLVGLSEDNQQGGSCLGCVTQGVAFSHCMNVSRFKLHACTNWQHLLSCHVLNLQLASPFLKFSNCTDNLQIMQICQWPVLVK